MAYRRWDVLGGYVQDGLVLPGVRSFGKVLVHPARPHGERPIPQPLGCGREHRDQVGGQGHGLNVLRPSGVTQFGGRESLCHCLGRDNDALGDRKSCPLQAGERRRLAARLGAVLERDVIE
jgi:hypothetical protein